MVIATPMSAMAQTDATWLGGLDDKWNTGVFNWVGDVAPNGSADIARFVDGGALNRTVDINGTLLEVQDMYISLTADGYNITDTNVTPGLLTIGSLTHNASGSNTVSAAITTSGAINVDSGALALTNSGNTIGGAVNVASGATLEAYAGSLGASTVTLNGGTAILSLGGADPLPTAGISYMQITDDADSGITSSKTYTHALDFGNQGAATVDTVVFANDVNIAAGGRTNAGTRTYATSNHQAANAPPGVSGNVASVFNDCRYNGPDLGYIELTGLTGGQWYDVRLYDRSWGYDVNDRTYYAVYDVGSDGDVDFTTPKIDQNRGHVAPMNMPGDVSWAMSYVYQADANGKIKVTIDMADDTSGSYHLYGMTNEEVGGGPLVSGALDMSGNDIVVTAGSTLQAITDSTATLGALTLTSGALTIEGAAGGTTFASIASDGATVGVTSTTDVTSTGALTLADNSQLAVTTPNFTAGSTALGNNSALNFSGGAATLGAVSITGPAAGITVNSAASATSIELATGDTLAVGTSGGGTLSTTTLTTSGTNGTIALAGGMQMTAATLSNAGTGTGLNVTGNGSLAIDAADITVVGGMALGVGPDSTLAASTAASASLNAATTTVNLSGGTFETSGVDTLVWTNGLKHYGFHQTDNNPNTLMDLNNNGDMMGGTAGDLANFDPTTVTEFHGEAVLTGDLSFNGDAAFINTGAVGQVDHYNNLWVGYLTADVGGNWTFKSTLDDDRVGIWIDLDQDGVFESTTPGLGSDRGEQLMWEQNNSNKTVSLTAGQKYLVAFTHGEGTGGSKAAFQFTSSSLSMRNIKPGDAAQTGLWEHKTGGVGAISMTDTDFVVTATSTLVATTDSTADFGSLELQDGIFTVSGAAGKTTFASIAGQTDLGAVTGVKTTDGPVELTGTLTLGDNTDLTIGQDVTITGGLALTETGGDGIVTTIRPEGVLDLSTYSQPGQQVSLTSGGTGTIDMRNLAASAADQTTFTAASGTLQFGGDNPLGGSPEALNLAGGTIQITGADAPAPAPAGAIAYYSFDDVAAGVAPDSSGSATTYDGTINGAGATVVAGHIGTGAMDFDGTDGYIGLGANINPLDGKSAWTLAWWSNQDTHQSGAQISSDPNTGTSRFIVQDSAVNGPVYANGDVFPDDVNTTMIADSQWHHYALTMDNPVNGTWKFYVDGELDDTTASHTFTMSDFELRMGQHTGTAWFDGMMDDVYIYDAVLDAAQIDTLYAGVVVGAIDMTSTDVIVTANSGLDAVTDSTAAFGALSFNGLGMLTTSGADGGVIFDGGTTVNVTSASGELGFETLVDTSPGAITIADGVDATITKTGAADLILDPSDPTFLGAGSLAFDVQTGRLIAQAGSNPLGDDNAVKINGGEVVLVAKDAATDPTFDNPVTSTANGGTLTAGRDGDGFARTVTIGSGTNHLTLDAGGTLTMQTLDGYTLNIGGNVAGDGNLSIAAASTVSVAGTLDAGTVTIDGSLEVAGAVTVNDLIANTGGSYSGPSDLTVANTLTLNGDLDLSSATLVVDGADVTVNGGTLTLQGGNSLGGGTPVASVDVSNGGGLTLNGATITTKKLGTPGGTFDMGATGSFIATGDVAVGPPATGPEQLVLSGGTMTITPANVTQAPANPLSHYAFDGNTDDGGTLGNTAGALVGTAGYAAGKFGQALSLDGANGNYFNTNQDAPYDFQNGAVTFGFWAQLDGTWDGSWEAMIAKGEGDTWRLARYSGTNDQVGYGQNSAQGPADITDNQWHHFIVRADQSTTSSEIFFDGASIATGTTSSLTGNTGFSLLIGENPGATGRTFGGLIDDVYIYDRWLSDAEVADLYANEYAAAAVSLPDLDIEMDAASPTTLAITSDVTLGDLTVDNSVTSPVILAFTGDSDLRLNLATTSFDAAITGAPGLIVNTEAPKVNLGDLDLSGVSDAVDPVMNKEGSGEWIITDMVTGYTGTATYNVNAGTLTLGDTGLVGSAINVNDGTTLKLSSSVGDTAYAETPTFSGDVTVLAGAADAGSTAAVITLPTINPLPGQTLTLGAEENYTLKISNPISADIVSAIGLGTTTLDNGGAATTSVSLSAGTLNVNNAAIVTPSISVTETGSLNLGVAQSTDNLLVDTSGTVSVTNPLTVTDKITLGAVVITDDTTMDIVGSNLADPTGTITVSGSSFDMGPIVIPAVAPAGVVALYTFESAAGGVTPNSGSGGAALDGAVLGDAVLAAGKVGQAMSFDGDGDYIDVEYDASLDMSAFTVSAWVNINSDPGPHPASYGILGTRIDGDTTFDVKVRTNDIHGDIGHGGGWINTAVDIGAADTGSNGQGGDLAPGQWYQVTYVVDDAAKQFKLYIDGDLKRTIGYSNTARFMKPGQSLWIGDDYIGHEYMDGLIDEVYIYDRALDGGEVTDLFNVGTPLVGGTVDIDMPNLALDLASGGPSATITLNDSTPTLGDLTMGAVTDLTIAVANNTSFNNVTVSAAGPTTITSGGATPGLTVRNTLQTAGGSDLTTSFSANGDLAVTNLNAVGTVGAPITVSAKNFTASGAVTFNEHASLALTSSTLAVTGGTTTFATDSGATGVDVIAVSSGAELVVATEGISTVALNVPEDATMNASAPVTVTNNADLGSLDIAVGGGSFALTGADLSDDATARTVTLQGGVTAFSGSITGGGVGGMTYIPITSDADSGIDSGKTYTHKVDFGNTAGTTVNGVVFDRNMSNGSTSIPNEHGGNYNFDIAAGQAVRELFKDMRYGDKDAEIILTGLTPDQWYDVRLYNRSWDAGAGNRFQDFLYNVSNDGSTEFSVTLNPDNPTIAPPGLDDVNRAFAMAYVYKAEANGTLKISVNSHIAGNTLHCYGLTNELTTVSEGISLPTTTVAATETSILSLGTADSLTLAGLDVSADKVLTVDCTSPTIALTNMTLGGDSMVHSTQAAATGPVTVTADAVDLSGGMNYLGDGTQLGGDGDTNATNLTLADNATIDWVFDGSGGNTSYLDVKGEITLGATLNVNVLDGVGIAGTEDIYIMVGLGGIDDTLLTSLNVPKPAGWDWTSVAIEFVGPGVEALVLKDAVFGVATQNPGDTNADDIVDAIDMDNFQLVFGLTGQDLLDASELLAINPFDADFDNDGDADLDDFVILRETFGDTYSTAPVVPDLSQTPEPATMSLLALGALAILRRRRRK